MKHLIGNNRLDDLIDDVVLFEENDITDGDVYHNLSYWQVHKNIAETTDNPKFNSDACKLILIDWINVANNRKLGHGLEDFGMKITKMNILLAVTFWTHKSIC